MHVSYEYCNTANENLVIQICSRLTCGKVPINENLYFFPHMNQKNIQKSLLQTVNLWQCNNLSLTLKVLVTTIDALGHFETG